MLTVNSPMKYLDGTLEPGTRVPDEIVARLRPHVLAAYKNQNKFVECTEEQAKEIRKRFLADQHAAETRLARKTIAKLEAELHAATAEVEAAADAARAAEASHAALVERRKDAEAEAQQTLKRINEELEMLVGLRDVHAEDMGASADADGEQEPEPDSSKTLPPKGKLRRMKRAQLAKVAESMGFTVGDANRGDILDTLLELHNTDSNHGEDAANEGTDQ